MSENEKSSTNMPAVLVVMLAMLGLAALPQGGGKPSESATRAGAGEAEIGSPGGVAADEKDLGPLATIKADLGLDTAAAVDTAAAADKAAADTASARVKAAVDDACRKPGDYPDEGVKILSSNHSLRFLIVLVPDPNDTSMSHEFDLTLNAAERGAESADYLAARWSSMPGFPKPSRVSPAPEGSKVGPSHVQGKLAAGGVDLEIKPGRRPPPKPLVPWPGSVLCRLSAREKRPAQVDLLLLLLVPESPTWGVDKDRLGEALRLIGRHRELHKECTDKPCASDVKDPVFRIVGPNFSGSFRSLAETLLKSSPAECADERFVLYNGRASSPDPGALDEILKDRVTFKSTIHDNPTLETALREYIKSTDFVDEKFRCAMLVESNTGFGRSTRGVPASGETDYYSFPLNVSMIRETYSAKGYLQSSEPVKLTSPERLSPLELAGRLGDRDLVPIVSPGLSAAVAEIGLSQMLLELERRRYPWVGIAATNPLDRLFLAEKVRVACPDIRIFFTNSTTLYSQRMFVPYLRGTLVASNYPLDVDSQAWTASPGNAGERAVDRIAFSHHYEEGIYNATVAHLADMKLDDSPSFIDYAFPGDASKTTAGPPIWISVVGQRGLYPVQVRRGPAPAPNKNAKQNPATVGLYEPNAAVSFELPRNDRTALVDASWVVVFFTLGVGAVVGSLWYLSGCTGLGDTRVGVSPGLRERIDHPSARKLVAVTIAAVFAQLVLLSAPAWMLQSLPYDPARGWFLRFLLASLAATALLAAGAATVVALVRLFLGGGPDPIGITEAVHRGVVGCLVLAFIAPPIYLTANQLWRPAPGGQPTAAAVKPLYRVADVRLYCTRATRLFNGVSPIVPMLILGAAGGTVLIGDWRRIGLRVRLNAIRRRVTTGAGPLSKVYEAYNTSGDAIDTPLKAWPEAGAWVALIPMVGLGAFAIAVSGVMPGTVEPWKAFRVIFLLAFGSTLGLLVLRLVETIGICRTLDRLLRRLAESALVRAFDRVPAHLAHENFWRPVSTQSVAEDDSDPRLDKQYEAVVLGYLSRRAAIAGDERLRSVDLAAMDARAASCPRPVRLATKDWWPAVNALTPLLEPFWAARPAIPRPAEGDKKPAGDDRDDWAGLESEDLRHWLRSAEDLIVMVLTRQLTWLRAAVESVFGFLVVGLVLMTLVLTSYPFEPQGPTFLLLGALTVVTIGVLVVVAVQANRDEVVSRLNKTPTDRFTLDRQFITTMVTFVIPLLGLLGALSYSLSDLFRSLFEPFFRGG